MLAKSDTEVVELVGACVLLACEFSARMGWFSADVGPIGPLWLPLIIPCLLLFPIRPGDAAYWLDNIPWAVAMGLFLNGDALPREIWIVRVILWAYLGARAAVMLRRRHQIQADARG